MMPTVNMSTLYLRGTTKDTKKSHRNSETEETWPSPEGGRGHKVQASGHFSVSIRRAGRLRFQLSPSPAVSLFSPVFVLQPLAFFPSQRLRTFAPLR
jgi:hypothetical protein